MATYVGETLLVKKSAAVVLLLLGILLIVAGLNEQSSPVIAVGVLSLLDGVLLLVAVEKAHSNIRGPSFISLRELLDQTAGRLDEHSETMAERVVAGTSQPVVRATSLPAYSANAMAQADHLTPCAIRRICLCPPVRRSTRRM